MTLFSGKKVFFLILSFLISHGSLEAQSSRVLIRLKEWGGKITAYRNGEVLSLLDLEDNMLFETYDLMETGPDGFARLELFSPVSVGTQISLMENTAFYTIYKTEGGKQKVEIVLLNGGMVFSENQLTGSGELVLTSESGELLVDSSAYSCVMGPEGSLLIVSFDGTVTCRNKQGDVLMARPGVAVEQLRSRQLREIPVEIVDLGAFKKGWLDQKLMSFKPVSMKALQTRAVQYIEDLDKFNAAYVELMKHRDIFKGWTQLSKGQLSESRTNRANRDKIAVSPSVFKMKTALFFFENAYYRVVDLRTLYLEKNIEKGFIWPGFSSDDFFIEFSNQKENLAWRMAQIRYILKLYAMVSWDLSPGMNLSP